MINIYDIINVEKIEKPSLFSHQNHIKTISRRIFSLMGKKTRLLFSNGWNWFKSFKKSGKLTVLLNFLDIIVVAKVYNFYPYPIAIHE